MRHADEIDTGQTALTPEDARDKAFDEMAAQRNKLYRERKALYDAATARAMGTEEANKFTQDCLAAVEAALDAYSAGQATYRSVIDEQYIEIPKKKFGIKIGTERVENVEKNWKYCQVRVLMNGVTERTTERDDKPFPYPVYVGYVIVVDIKAPWVEAAIIAALDGAGYPRATYVDDSGFPMSFKLAYALPTKHL